MSTPLGRNLLKAARLWNGFTQQERKAIADCTNVKFKGNIPRFKWASLQMDERREILRCMQDFGMV